MGRPTALGLVLGLGAVWTWAQSASLLVSPALSRFLAMSSAQLIELARVQRGWQADLAHSRKQAMQLTAKSDLAGLCARTQELRARARADALAVLTDAQRTRVQDLQEAYAKMPLVEAAQRLQLLPADLQGPPLALSAGSVDTDFRYVRSAPEVLPGCPAPTSRPYATQDYKPPVSAAPRRD